jgi:hypothetical protein
LSAMNDQLYCWQMKNLLILLSCILFYACKKDKPYVPVTICPDLSNDFDTIQNYVQGDWDWRENRTYDRGGLFYQSPGTEGYTVQLSIHNNDVVFFKSYSIPIAYKFKILREKAITQWPDDNEPIMALYEITNGNYHHYYRIYMCKEYLLLDLSYKSDVSPEMIYKRIR